jgi:hypothetical protein
MGVYKHYQAMPEGGRLAGRLRTDRLLCVLYAELIHHPAGPCDTARLDRGEREACLNEIAGNPVFGSRAAVDRLYADLQAELTRAATEFPGLPQRSAYFKLQGFDQQLETALAGTSRPDAEDLARMLIWGAEAFAPAGFGGRNVQLRVVPPLLGAEAAGLLQGLDPEPFDGCEEEWEVVKQPLPPAPPPKRRGGPEAARNSHHRRCVCLTPPLRSGEGVGGRGSFTDSGRSSAACMSRPPPGARQS